MVFHPERGADRRLPITADGLNAAPPDGAVTPVRHSSTREDHVSMKRVLILMVGLLSVAGTAFGAEVVTSAGSNALLFQFNGLDNLGIGNFQGGIGIRHYLKDRVAIRPSVTFDLGTVKDKMPADENLSEVKTTDTGGGVNLVLENHFGKGGSVSPYTGIGAGVNFAQRKVENVFTSTPTTGAVTETKDKGTNFQGFAVLGFEWGFAESITLGGEYRLGFTTGSGSREVTQQGVGTNKTNDNSGFGVGVNSANQGALFISVAW
jgi:hypothetical protein